MGVTPRPGLKVCYRFLAQSYMYEEHELTVHSVDATSRTLETSHGNMTWEYWDWLVERQMVVAIPAQLLEA
jgi:hypothetical protein